jgi:hypothetical protein
MGRERTISRLAGVTKAESGLRLSDSVSHLGLPGNSPAIQTVPETDTGGLVEHTKALERTALKELGKLPA